MHLVLESGSLVSPVDNLTITLSDLLCRVVIKEELKIL